MICLQELIHRALLFASADLEGFLLKKLYIGMNAPYVDDNTSELTEDFYMESFLQTLIKDALILYY